MIDPAVPNNFHDVEGAEKKPSVTVEINEAEVRELLTGKPAAESSNHTSSASNE